MLSGCQELLIALPIVAASCLCQLLLPITTANCKCLLLLTTANININNSIRFVTPPRII